MALGDWSRSGERPVRMRRPTMMVALRRVLDITGEVESLWCASCGCWRITTWVLVRIGCAGSVWQRHTGAGREQLEQMDRRPPADSSSVVPAGVEGWSVGFPGSRSMHSNGKATETILVKNDRPEPGKVSEFQNQPFFIPP